MQNFSRAKRILLALAASALVALTLLALPTPRVNAQSAGNGKIEGQLVNSTKDAPPGATANLSVVLYTVPQTATAMITTTATSDANGKFSFSSLDTISTTRYFVESNYGGVNYYSDVLAFSPPTTVTLPASIEVYESTSDPSVVQVAQTHFVFDVQSPWLTVQEIIAIENTSDRVYVGAAIGGPHRATLALPILPKAIDLQFDDPNLGNTVLQGDDVLTYTLPIGPGRDQIVFQYSVPFTPPAYDFNLTLPYATGKFGLYMVDVGQKISSQQLKPAPNPMANTPGAPTFLAAAMDAVAAGTTIKATFTNLPAATTQPGATTTPATAKPADNTQTIGLIVLGIAAVAALALLAYPILRRRAAAAQAAVTSVDNERMELLQDIADLDDEFEAGKITEAEYKEQRAALKAKLLEQEA